jgi:5-hydroxyisourate hydrolase
VITTHVLDTSLGAPARGVKVSLEAGGEAGAWTAVAAAVTDDDGRVRGLNAAGPLAAGRYRLVFDTAAYFAARGVATFYPEVVVVFTAADASAHYHVPLLLSPFGYTTYRGS